MFINIRNIIVKCVQEFVIPNKQTSKRTSKKGTKFVWKGGTEKKWNKFGSHWCNCSHLNYITPHHTTRCRSSLHACSIIFRIDLLVFIKNFNINPKDFRLTYKTVCMYTAHHSTGTYFYRLYVHFVQSTKEQR